MDIRQKFVGLKVISVDASFISLFHFTRFLRANSLNDCWLCVVDVAFPLSEPVWTRTLRPSTKVSGAHETGKV